VTPCSPIEINWRFGEAYCRRYMASMLKASLNVPQKRLEILLSSKTTVNFYRTTRRRPAEHNILQSFSTPISDTNCLRPLEHWDHGFKSHSRHEYLYVRLFCVCVVLCVGSGLATSWSPIQGALPTVCRLRNWKSDQGPAKGCRAKDRYTLKTAISK
jgi:hypothetical protein